MARGKVKAVKLEILEKRKRRLTTHRRMKETLKKAAYELSMLCGIPTAVVCFALDGWLDAWPEDEGAVRDIIGSHRSPGTETRSEGHLNFPGYLAAQIAKTICGQGWDLPPPDDIPEESLRGMISSVESAREAIKKKIEQLKEDFRSNQGDSHGDPGREQREGFPRNNPAFMEGCSDVPVVSKAAMDDGPGQGHGACVPMELKQGEGVAANAYPPSFSTASSDFSCERKDPALSMPLPFMPPPSTGAASENNVASSSDRPFLPQENQFVKGGGDEGNANAQ